MNCLHSIVSPPCTLQQRSFCSRAARSRLSITPQKREKYRIRCDAQPEAKPYVVSLGEALFDLLAVEVDVPKEKVKNWTPYPGGAPANTACALAKLGVPVVFVSALGEDGLGTEMLAVLEECGVDVKGVQRILRPTRDVLVTRTSAGEREFSGFGVAESDEYADCFISAEKLPVDKIKSASLLVTGTLGLACPVTGEALRTAVAAAKQGNCKVVVDINWRPVFWKDEEEARGVIRDYIKSADLLKFADTEVEWMFGISAQEALEQPEKVLPLCPEAMGVLVSGGGAGSSYAFRGVAGKSEISGFVPVFEVSVVDTTGAGDAFLGGFLYKVVQSGGLQNLISNPDLVKEAVYFGSACGAFTCSGGGAIAAQPTLQQAMEFLEKGSPKVA